MLLVMFSGGYLFFAACRRGKERPWLDKQRLKGTPYEKYSDHIQSSAQWLKEHGAEDVYVQSRDGLRLHGLWISAREPKGTVLLAHGYRSCLLVDFGMVFDFYHSLGLNLLIPDQRSHGKSQGRYITFGVKESRDMLCWIQYHGEKLGGGQLLLSGLSMGASTMLYLADQQLPGEVKAMIVDCGFTSPAQILSCVYTKVTHLPAIPSIWAAELFARVLAGFSLYERDSRKILPHSRLPVLMVHGTGDDFVPCYMTRQGYAACGSEKELLLVEGAGHGTSYLKNKPLYQQRVLAFLKKHMGVTP